MLAVWARATLTMSQTFSPGTIIPDGSPAGVVVSGTFSQTGFDSPVLHATVGLNLSGGCNSDLYAYLINPNGTLVILLNQPGAAVNGFGADGPGMNITLQDGANDHGSIQTETGGGVLSGSYNAAGNLSSFNGGSANGTWELFFADLGSGGGSGPSTLNSWTLTLSVVPEPVTLSLGLFCMMMLALAGLRWAWTPG